MVKLKSLAVAGWLALFTDNISPVRFSGVHILFECLGTVPDDRQNGFFYSNFQHIFWDEMSFLLLEREKDLRVQ